LPDEDAFPPSEIDWAVVQSSAVNFAEMIHTYYQALVNAGFNVNDAMTLTVAYQQTIWK